MIRFECSCGKRLKVTRADAGKTVECPACGAMLTAPGGAESGGSAADALARAMREVLEPPPPDAPVAEVVADVPEASALDALARAAQPGDARRPTSAAAGRSARTPGRSAPGAKRSAASRGRSSSSGSRGSMGARTPSPRPALPTGRPSSNHRPVLIGVGLSVLIVVLLVIAAAFVGGGGGRKPTEPQAMDAPPTTASQEQPKRKRPPTTGEMFKSVPFQESDGSQ